MDARGPSPQAKALFDQFRLLKPAEDTPVSLEVERENTRHAEELTGVPAGVRFERERIAGVSGIWCIPEKDDDTCVGVFLHGGAFGLMSASTHARMAGHLASACGARIFVPDYRLAPEHPFPEGLNDCIKVIEAVMVDNPDRPLVLSGDSAGGGLVVSAALALRDAGKTLPACLVVMSPSLDLTLGSPSVKANRENDVILRQANLKYFVDIYLQGEDPRTPLASPIYAECHGLPPTYIQGAECDMIRDDGVRFAERLREAGVSVRLDIFEHMQHSFQFFAGRMPEADEALALVASYVRGLLGQTE